MFYNALQRGAFFDPDQVNPDSDTEICCPLEKNWLGLPIRYRAGCGVGVRRMNCRLWNHGRSIGTIEAGQTIVCQCDEDDGLLIGCLQALATLRPDHGRRAAVRWFACFCRSDFFWVARDALIGGRMMSLATTDNALLFQEKNRFEGLMILNPHRRASACWK